MKILDGRKTFFQWDVKAKITSSKFKAGDMIHFDNGTTPETVTVKAYELNGQVVADVPNGMLQNANDICVYHYRWDTDGSGRTLQAQSFGVCARPKPVDYALTETEVIGYGLLDKRVSELEKNGGGSGTPGRGIDHIEINENGELVIYYTDDTSDNLGVITGGGDAGGGEEPEIDEGEKIYTIEQSGIYYFNDTLTEAIFEQDLSYSIKDGWAYEQMVKIKAFYDGDAWKLTFVYGWDGESTTQLDWMDERAINISDSGQTVSKEFYEWFTANTTREDL